MTGKSFDVGVIGLSGMSAFLRVEDFPSPGETIVGSSLFWEYGGKGFNQAAACARLGARTFFLSAVGDDDYGKNCKAEMDKLGVAHSFMIPKTGHKTDFAVIMTDQTGENIVAVVPDASEQLTAEDIKQSEQFLSECNILLAQFEVPFEALLAVLEIGEKKNIPVILNPAPAKRYVPDFLRRFAVLTPNEGEAYELLGIPQEHTLEELAEAYMKAGMPRTVITLGEKGSLIIEAAGTEHISPYSSGKAIDTTGAGDVFNAALALQLSEGASLKEAARFASAAAGLSIMKKGVLNSLPTREETEKLLTKQTPIIAKKHLILMEHPESE